MKMENRKQHVVMNLVPGIILSIFVMVIGIYGADILGKMLVSLGVLSPGSKTPISSIFVAILLGIIIKNTTDVSRMFRSGITFSVKYALRAGIILLGLRLSLVEALKLGAFGIPLIICCIFIGLSITIYLTRLMKQSERLGTLIACGTGICGVTAIMATSPVIRAKENEISYAIANITIFGLVGMALYPFLAHTFFADDPIKAGLFLGTSIHDTAQVTGAALIYDQIFQSEEVVNVATVTKLTRNLFIIVIIPLVSYMFFKRENEGSGENTQVLPKWYTFIPLFVVGFLLLSLLRTVGDFTLTNSGEAFGFLAEHTWQSFYDSTSAFGTNYLLGMAMAGVGLSTDFKMFKGIGLKPFYIGFIAAVSIGCVSFLLVSLFGHLVVI